jgi:hypothetical protein
VTRAALCQRRQCLVIDRFALANRACLPSSRELSTTNRRLVRAAISLARRGVRRGSFGFKVSDEVPKAAYFQSLPSHREMLSRSQVLRRVDSSARLNWRNAPGPLAMWLALPDVCNLQRVYDTLEGRPASLAASPTARFINSASYRESSALNQAPRGGRTARD